MNFIVCNQIFLKIALFGAPLRGGGSENSVAAPTLSENRSGTLREVASVVRRRKKCSIRTLWIVVRIVGL